MQTSTTTPQHLWDLITDAQTITLLTHMNPDGDGISACAALHRILQRLEKTVEAVYPSKPAHPYLFHVTPYHIAQHTLQPDLIIALDTGSQERLYFPDAYANIPLINIDHHVNNTAYGTFNVIDADASSACEVLYALLKQWCPELIDKTVADPLLYGILYDTQTFHTKNTSAGTLRTAAELMDKGASLFELKTDLLSHKSPQIIKLWADVLERVTITNNGKAAISYIALADIKQYDLKPASLAGFINFLAEISGIDVVAIIYEFKKDGVKLSLRSKETDVNAIAAHFDGGGHIHAAGAVTSESLEDTYRKLKKLLEKHL